MPGQEISPELKQFIQDFIQSVEQLEILLLLRTQPNREWTPKDVFQVIQSNEGSIAKRLAQFAESGFFVASQTEPPTYRYCVRSKELDCRVEEISTFYRVRPVLLIETIFKPPTDPLQSFADAFRFKKK